MLRYRSSVRLGGSFAVLIGLVAGLSACSTSDDDDDDHGSGANDGGEQVSDAGPTQPSLVGVWRSDCTALSATNYARATVTYTESEYQRNVGGYSDANCVNRLTQIAQHRTYETGNPVPNLQDTWEIDYTYGTTTATLGTIAGANYANSIALYGYTDWTVDVAKDVTGRSQNASEAVPALGTVFYTIFKVEGDDLIGGDTATGDGTTPSTRPAALDRSVTLHRQ